MNGWTRWLPVGALIAAVAAAGLLGGRLILTPAQGDLLVLASARQPDRMAATALALHSTSGWTALGTSRAQSVPAAPDTVNLLEVRVPIGSYDAIRVGAQVLAIRLEVRQIALTPVLVGVSAGQASKDSLYAGSQGVSLGLNELAGQLKSMPTFNLVDQFGRPFSNRDIAGHSVLIAAFHTSCHTTCPLYTGLFMQLQHKLPPSVLLIEATTAPDEDSPDVLRSYAGQVGASWTFLTGTPEQMTAFWAPFFVQLSGAESHSSMLGIVDDHGYIRTYWQGVPDVGGTLPSDLAAQLNSDGQQELRSGGNRWGVAQILDTLGAVGGLAARSTGGEGAAPDFTLATLDGRRASLSDYRGRPVLINFWATYCVPCRVEMPLLQRMADKHPNLVVLLIDERDNTPAARGFIGDLHIRSTVLLDTDGKAGDQYRIAGLPTTIFVRSDGSIEGRYLGQTSEQILSPHIGAIGG